MYKVSKSSLFMAGISGWQEYERRDYKRENRNQKLWFREYRGSEISTVRILADRFYLNTETP